MNSQELEWKAMCELYGEQNLINANRVDDAKRSAYLACSRRERVTRLSSMHGGFFSDEENAQITHFAKQGVKVRLK